MDNDGTKTVTVTQPDLKVASGSTPPIPRTVAEYMLYKIDRSIAILGLIVLGWWALRVESTESLQIAIAVVGVLGGYIGGRTGN